MDKIEVRGARVHNLRNIDVDIPLNQLVAIAGVSGSGKSSLALGTLYAEGSRRYLEALSTYTRRRISQSGHADVDEVRHVPSALALHQRPAVPGVRSTFGTSSELLNSLRLLFSRCGSYKCPNGHYVKPGMQEALMIPYKCEECGTEFEGLGAEQLAFNSDGACPTCSGTGIMRKVDPSKFVPDENKTVRGGAVLPWNSFGLMAMPQVAEAMGVRIDVPFKELTKKERDIIFNGPEIKKMIPYHSKNGKVFELNCLYYNANVAAQNSLNGVTSDKGLERLRAFITEAPCDDCHGSRINKAAREILIGGKNLAEVSAMTLEETLVWIKTVPETLPEEIRSMARDIIRSYTDNAKRLLDLGLGYLSLDRASSTLSTGERQRVQMARAVRNETTGVLYVLDEPSIGLHPSNIKGLMEVIDSLIKDGNSVVLVDHDVNIIKKADYIIEMGPGAGSKGGKVIAKGNLEQILSSEHSKIARFIEDDNAALTRNRANKDEVFANGKLHLETNAIHTVKPLTVNIPKGRLVAITGVSGSGKTTLVLESLMPALKNVNENLPLPECVKSIDTGGIKRANLIDATPIGINVRSTVATYAGIHDAMRKLYANLPESKKRSLKNSDFSYNTGSLRCETCDGTGQISMDVQFLPDVVVECPDCHGARYKDEADGIEYLSTNGIKLSIQDAMKLTVSEALEAFGDIAAIRNKLEILQGLGLGYLTLGEETPALSGGEAQRLKLASEMSKVQTDALFVFDEPSIGLHPLDIQILLGVFQQLVDKGATVVVIEHDLDVIRNADYIIDMGPGGGEAGGTIVASGTVEDIKYCAESITGKYL